jgi:hypothetical protein
MAVTKVIAYYGDFIATADMDGDFDKSALPGGLTLTHYFTV